MKTKYISAPYLLWMAIFIFAPLCLVVYFAFTDKRGNFTFENMSALSTYAPVFLRSIILAGVATVVCLVMAYPISYFMSRMKANRQKVMMMVIMLPMWMNFLLRTYAWMSLLERNGLINKFFGLFGIGPFNMINTNGAVILGMVYNFLPFMVLPIYNVLVKIDKNVINAARDLGANPIQTFMKIILPLSVPGIISGITMVFVPALTTFIISTILGGSKILLIGNVIEQEFTQTGNWNLGSGLSIVLMMFIIFNMVISAVTDKDGEAQTL